MQLACKKIKESSLAEKAYTQGAVVGLLFAFNFYTETNGIGGRIANFLDRKAGANVASTCTQAAYEAEAQRNKLGLQ